MDIIRLQALEKKLNDNSRSYYNQFRYWCASFLFTESEKYLIDKVLWNQIDTLDGIIISEKWEDREHISNEIIDLNGLMNVFKHKIK